jgi:hypothetical protein
MKPTEQYFELRFKFKTVSKSGDRISAAEFRLNLAEGLRDFFEKQLPARKVPPRNDYEVKIEVIEPVLLDEELKQP